MAAQARTDWPRVALAALVAPLVLLLAAPLVVLAPFAAFQSVSMRPTGLGLPSSPSGYLVLALFVGVAALVRGYLLTLVLCVPTYLALIRLQARRRLAVVTAAAIGFVAPLAISAVLALANPRPPPHPLGPITYVALMLPSRSAAWS